MALFSTLDAALDRVVKTTGEVGFIDGARDERRLSFALLARGADRMLAVLQADGARRGDAVILFIDDNLRFVQFFWAAIRGGLIPVPVAVGGSRAHRDKLVNIWSRMGQPRVIASADNGERLVEHARQSESGVAEALAASLRPDAPEPVEQNAERVQVTPNDTAMIQFSSGSTGAPKGVVLSHANVVANIHAINEASRFTDNEIALSWMPLTHDMGLIGFHLNFLCLGHSHYLMRTDLFARRPRLWLEKAAEKKATILCSPNFGYRHTLRALNARGQPDIDLSAVRLIYNGAEPIAPALAREFVDTLAPAGLDRSVLFPVYGLAEASLAVAFPEPGAGLSGCHVDASRLGVGESVNRADAGHALELARLGRPIPGMEIAVVDDDSQPCPESVVGHIHIRGDSVTAGYYDDPAANDAAFSANGWLDTGDLGFIVEGDLVVTGRAREIIFVNGQNLYPQDLEAMAARVGDIGDDRVAAVGVRAPGGDADDVVVFAVHRGPTADFAETAGQLAARLNEYAGLAVARVLPIDRLPRTTSGKVQRTALAERYAAGEFATVAAELDALLETRGDSEPARLRDSTAGTLKTICDDVAPDKAIASADNLFEIGLSSLELAQIHEGIDSRWPGRLAVTDLFDYPTINDLAGVLDSLNSRDRV